MRARTATVGDLEAVFQELSKRMSDEYVAAGKDSKVAYDNLMMNLKEGRAHALVEKDAPLAIVAWHEQQDVANTLFAAREDFFTASSVRFCKRHIRRIQALTGNLPVRSRSWVDRDEIVRRAAPDVVEARFDDFRFTNISYDSQTVSGDLGVEDFTAEPYPAGQFSPALFPGLF